MASIAEIMQLCRLCLVKEQVNVPIFEEQDDVRQIFVKIAACLPVKVSKEDNLPKKICDGCLYKLELLYQFSNTTTNAEKQLLSWLNEAGLDTDKNSTNKTDDPIPVVSKITTNSKTEPNNVAQDSLSLEAKSYILQQQQLPYESDEFPFQDDDFEEQPPADAPAVSNTEDVEQPPPKRRRTAAPTLLQEPPDESDEDADYVPIEEPAKTDEGSEDEAMVESSLIEVLNEEEQPGPSGIGKAEAQPAVPTKRKRRGKRERNTNEYVCYICHDGIQMRSTALRHHFVKNHPSVTIRYTKKLFKESHVCEICKEEFSSLKELNEHLDTHEDQHVCDICKQTFKRILDYILHLHDHDPDNAYQCQLCSYTSMKKNALVEHLNVHVNNKGIYKCDICEKRFKIQSYLEEHKNYHTGDKPYTCDICGKAFSYSRYVYHHKVKMHQEQVLEIPQEFSCLHCEKEFKNKKQLTNHIFNFHSGKNICHVCGKQISNQVNLRKHMKIHLGIKRYQCRFCEKKFVDKMHVDEHERVHTGIKPYACQHCGKGFTQRSSRKIHERTHTNERPYICHLCNKGCISRAALNLHLKHCKGYC